MALSGIVITCLKIGAVGRDGVVLPIVGDRFWHEGTSTTTGSGVTTNAAPYGTEGDVVFEVSSSVDLLVATGKNPSAALAGGSGSTAAVMVRAGTERQISASDGDKLAWAVL